MGKLRGKNHVLKIARLQNQYYAIYNTPEYPFFLNPSNIGNMQL